MSAFQDCLASDLAIFMSLDEFADVHDIDGQHVACVFDSDIIKGGSSYDGIYVSTKKLYVKASDLDGRPIEGQHMHVDGKLYLVADCAENTGMLEITLEANRA